MLSNGAVDSICTDFDELNGDRIFVLCRPVNLGQHACLPVWNTPCLVQVTDVHCRVNLCSYPLLFHVDIRIVKI